MTHYTHADAESDAGRNVFLDKISLRLDAASDTLREFADNLDGRTCITTDEADDLRHAVAEVATSLQIVEAISRHFRADLTAPGGISADALMARRDTNNELHARGLVAAALAGVRS